MPNGAVSDDVGIPSSTDSLTLLPSSTVQTKPDSIGWARATRALIFMALFGDSQIAFVFSS